MITYDRGTWFVTYDPTSVHAFTTEALARAFMARVAAL